MIHVLLWWVAVGVSGEPPRTPSARPMAPGYGWSRPAGKRHHRPDRPPTLPGMEAVVLDCPKCHTVIEEDVTNCLTSGTELRSHLASFPTSVSRRGNTGFAGPSAPHAHRRGGSGHLIRERSSYARRTVREPSASPFRPSVRPKSAWSAEAAERY
jgi:hypothetical protein